MSTNDIVRPNGGPRCLWLLFWEFAKITTMVIGGGYVILSAAEAVFVRRRRWIDAEDFLNLTAIAQTVPGIIACNGAIYIGWRVAGLRGACCALFGTVLPPMAVIIALAAVLESLPLDNPYVNGAFAGVNGCVAGLIAATAWKLWPKAMKGVVELLLAGAVVVGMLVFRINPGLLMLLAIPCGILYCYVKCRAAREKLS